MAQFQIWNFEDDDSTAQLNYWLAGIITPGVYGGFDASAFGASLNLTLNMDSAFLLTRTDQVQERRGVIRTKQGAAIQENEDIVLAISAGDITDDRIDLIVLEHEYVFAQGGSTGIYSIIEGTPAPTPVEPALTDEPIQIIVGALYVPAGTTQLDDPGVVYTKRPIPSIADGLIAYQDRPNTFSMDNVFDGYFATKWDAAIISPNGSEVLTITPRHTFLVDDSVHDTISEISSSAPVGTKIMLILQNAMTINSGPELFLVSGWANFTALSGEVLVFERIATGWILRQATKHNPDKGGLAENNEWSGTNEFDNLVTLDDLVARKTLTEKHVAAPISPSANLLTLSDGNSFVVDNATSSAFNSITTKAVGTWIKLTFNNAITISTSSSLLFPNFWSSPFTTIAGETLFLEFSAEAPDLWEIKMALHHNPDVVTQTIIIEIGDWDMFADSSKLVAHGLSDHTDIRSIDCIIRDDTDTLNQPLDRGTPPAGSISAWSDTNIQLDRLAAGFYDTTDFDSTSYNRGWIHIEVAL